MNNHNLQRVVDNQFFCDFFSFFFKNFEIGLLGFFSFMIRLNYVIVFRILTRSFFRRLPFFYNAIFFKILSSANVIEIYKKLRSKFFSSFFEAYNCGIFYKPYDFAFNSSYNISFYKPYELFFLIKRLYKFSNSSYRIYKKSYLFFYQNMIKHLYLHYLYFVKKVKDYWDNEKARVDFKSNVRKKFKLRLFKDKFSNKLFTDCFLDKLFDSTFTIKNTSKSVVSANCKRMVFNYLLTDIRKRFFYAPKRKRKSKSKRLL
jgi:hypothetical protein